jgi:hypothetical protein
VALAGLLVLAGCSAVGTPAQRGPTPTLTPAPVPGDATGETTRQRPDFLRGSVEPWTVGDAHAATLAGRNYTWVLARNRTTYDLEFYNTGRQSVRVVRVANATTYRVDRRVRRTNGTSSEFGDWRAATTEYAAGGAVLERRPPGGPVRIRPVRQPRNGEGVVADRAEAVVARYLAANRITVDRRTDDGGTVYVVRGDGAPSRLAAANGSVTEYRVRALVRPDGRVLALRARWQEGRTVVTVDSTVRAVGTTSVTPPAWVTDTPSLDEAAATNGSSPDDWFVDAELRAAAAARDGNGTVATSGASGTATWVGWPAWADDD